MREIRKGERKAIMEVFWYCLSTVRVRVRAAFSEKKTPLLLVAVVHCACADLHPVWKEFRVLSGEVQSELWLQGLRDAASLLDQIRTDFDGRQKIRVRLRVRMGSP